MFFMSEFERHSALKMVVLKIEGSFGRGSVQGVRPAVVDLYLMKHDWNRQACRYMLTDTLSQKMVAYQRPLFLVQENIKQI